MVNTPQGNRLNTACIYTRIQRRPATARMLLLMIGCILFTCFGHTQSAGHSLAASYLGLGAYSKTFADVFSSASNQATLARLKSLSAGIYAERRFLLNELSLYNVSICFPIQHGGIGISAKYFGHKGFNQSQLSVAYGKQLGKIDAGIQFNYHSIAIAGYGKDALFNLEAGMIWRLSDKVYTGLHFANPISGKFGENGSEKIAAVYTVGIGYEPSDKVFLSAEIVKEQSKSVVIQTGLQYAFASKFFARIGLLTETSNVYLGVGWKLNGLRVDVITTYHPQLGITPGLLLLFATNRNTE